MKTLRTIFTIVFTLMFSSTSFADNLILKCESYRFHDDDWVGNILFVKIDFKTSRVLMKQPADDTVEGWVIHKLMFSDENIFKIRQCRATPCVGDKDFFDHIDRTTGRFTSFVSNRIVGREPIDGWMKSLEYNCKISDRLF